MREPIQGIDLHNRQIHKNAMQWEKKVVLREIYTQFYQLIASCLLADAGGMTVELGSGIGKIKTVIPHCITTDLFSNPWLDRTENAYRLSFETGSVANLILFDVWHHLEFPGLALKEFQRVLLPHGQIIIFEPAAGLLGKLIYGNFHHEPLGLDQPLPWMPEPDVPYVEKYYANQSNAWRMFRSGEGLGLISDWNVLNQKYLSSLAYIGTGGFSGPQLYPRMLLGPINFIDSILSRMPDLFATRMLVILQKMNRA